LQSNIFEYYLFQLFLVGFS